MKIKNKTIIAGLICGAFLLVTSASAQNDTLNLLFLGNSHTYFNNLPHMFKFLAESGGYPCYVDSNTPAGYTLEGHSTNPISLAKIARGGWDYVILQENSLYPVIDFYRYGSMYPSAARLDTLIRASGSQTALFMTWGWRGGGQRDLNGHYSAPFADYFEMQDTMTAAYTMLADMLPAFLVPAGCAWARAMSTDTLLDLWNYTDNYHPNRKGSYLAACVFYARFFRESPVGLSYIAGLTPDTAAFLQNMAEQTVMGIEDEPGRLPQSFWLDQNFPNPFNSQTTIHYGSNHDARITLKIFDILGRVVSVPVNGNLSAGPKSIIWDGRDDQGINVCSGIYFYQIQVDGQTRSKRLLLLK